MDIISYLPVSIRDRIVSFLPMEDAVRTSVLSKQWRHVCSSLSNLMFDQLTFKSNTVSFSDFVYQTLVQHDGSDVDKIYLSVDFDLASARHLNSWILFAIRHNVKDFDLSLFGGLDTLPPQLFTCKSLTSLRLFGIAPKLPTFVELPVLKTMYLEDIKFYDASQSNKLISSCPMLENLTFMQCSWTDSDSRVLIISNPNLRFLTLSPTIPFPDVEISCPILHQIKCGSNPPDIGMDTLSSLAEVEFVFGSACLSLTKTPDEHMSKLLMGLRNVVSLHLDSFCMELLTRDRDFLSHLPNSCCTLKDLHLKLYPTRPQVQVATFLLRSYPYLETLHVSFYVWIYGTSTDVLNQEGYWQLPEVSTEGTLNQLKKVGIVGFGGNDCEFEFVSHLMKNASTMEQMNFIFSPKVLLDVVSKTIVSEKLLKFTPISPNANISFVAPHFSANYSVRRQ